MERRDFKFENLETLRLLLRKPGKEDAADMFEYSSDEQVTGFLTWGPSKSLEDTKTFLEGVSRKIEMGELFDWGLILKKTGKFIGTCGFVSLDFNNRSGEIGYILSKKHWNRGIMTEALNRVIRYGFESLGLKRIEAKCDKENISSERVLEKVGMKNEGLLRKAQYSKNRYRDLKIYSLLSDEFEKRRDSRIGKHSKI